MDTTAATFTIYFEGPFWVGIYERTQNGSLEVCRVVFGAEPKDYEVYDFLLKYWGCMQFSPPVAAGQAPAEIRNPKRARRTAKQSMTHKGTGTKAQQALQMQRKRLDGLPCVNNVRRKSTGAGKGLTCPCVLFVRRLYAGPFAKSALQNGGRIEILVVGCS